MIDIAFKATLRKDVIEKTLKTFRTIFFVEEPCHLVGNVDNVGVDTFDEVMEIINYYFPDNDVTLTLEPHSGLAYYNILRRCKADIVLMLEDDWELMTFANWSFLMNIFDKNPDLQALRFMVAGFRELHGGELIQRDGWCEIPPDNKFWQLTTRPTLFRGSFIKKIMKTFDGTLNLEKWMIANDELKEGGRFGLCPDIIVRDIGRAWRQQHGYHKGAHDKNGGFTQWIKTV